MVTSDQSSSVGALLVGKQHICIFTHVAPDGDALGSSLGLLHWLRDPANPYTHGEPEVHVVVPTRFPAFLAWLPAADDIIVYDPQTDDQALVAGQHAEAKAVVDGSDLIFCLDFNEPKRIGNVAPLLQSATCPKILVDHHLHPCHEMVDEVISYSEAPAASYLVLDLINALTPAPYLLSLEAATALYTGLMTDTGNFAFNSNNPVLYEMIAQLLRSGINKDKIFDSVFNQFSVNRLRFTGFCLYHKMRIFPKYHAALIALSSEELKRFNFQSGDAEGIVNMPLQIADVYYSCFMREDVDKIKLSFRSQGDRPVNEFAHAFFNGGGHMNAAGGESYLSLQETIKMFEDHYQEFFRRD